MSFDPDSVSALRRLLPGVPRGMVADSFTDAEWHALIPPLRRLALRHLAAAPRVMPSFVAWGVHDLPADAPLLPPPPRHCRCSPGRSAPPADRKAARRYADQIIFEGFDPRRYGHGFGGSGLNSLRVRRSANSPRS